MNVNYVSIIQRRIRRWNHEEFKKSFCIKISIKPKMKIIIDKTNEKKDIEFTGKAIELLKILQINPETVIIAKNNELITVNDSISNKDTIKILSVISGG